MKSLLLEFLLFDDFDYTDSNSLFHISYGESTEWGIFRENFNTHWFLWNKFDHGSITRFNEFWFLFNNFTCSSIVLWLNFGEFASNMSSVAIQYWAITVLDLSWVIDDNNLGGETITFTGWVILGIRAYISSL